MSYTRPFGELRKRIQPSSSLTGWQDAEDVQFFLPRSYVAMSPIHRVSSLGFPQENSSNSGERHFSGRRHVRQRTLEIASRPLRSAEIESDAAEENRSVFSEPGPIATSTQIDASDDRGFNHSL